MLLSSDFIMLPVALPYWVLDIGGKIELYVISSSIYIILGSSISKSNPSFLYFLLAWFSISSLILIYSYNLLNCISFILSYRSAFYSFLENSIFSTNMVFSLTIWLRISSYMSFKPEFFHSWAKFSLRFKSIITFWLVVSSTFFSS